MDEVIDRKLKTYGEFDDGVVSEMRCPECGGPVRVYDTMSMKTWGCMVVGCGYSGNDW